MSHDDYPYRVFLSYSQEDAKEAKQIVEWLGQQKLQPVWDQHNPGGWPFLDEIRNQIDHCHLFIPLLTAQSVRSSWVNHEIGYAMGRNLPVFPLSLRGGLPEGMAAGINAVKGECVDDLLVRLTRPVINQRVKSANTAAVFECADLSETRTEAIIKHCQLVEALTSNYHQPVRHRAAFGSFSLPSDPDDPIWLNRYDDRPPNKHRYERLSMERQELEKHASRFGCDLILYPTLPDLSAEATRARKEVLQSFLQTMSELAVPVRVAFDKCALEENLIIVGDWFFVESLTPSPEGFRHTTITSHAPTVLKRIEAFERQFNRLDWQRPDDAIGGLDGEF